MFHCMVFQVESPIKKQEMRNFTMKKKKNNFLDYIPQIHPDITWDENNKKRITIHVKNKGFYNRVAQFFFKKT